MTTQTTNPTGGGLSAAAASPNPTRTTKSADATKIPKPAVSPASACRGPTRLCDLIERARRGEVRTADRVGVLWPERGETS